MTPEQRRLIFGLVVLPGGAAPLSPEEFLRRWPADDGERLSIELLADAVRRQDAEDVEWALVVGAEFGFTDQHVGHLTALAGSEWHVQHENVAQALAQIGYSSSR